MKQSENKIRVHSQNPLPPRAIQNMKKECISLHAIVPGSEFGWHLSNQPRHGTKPKKSPLRWWFMAGSSGIEIVYSNIDCENQI